MISMSQEHSIRQLKKQGETVSAIARQVGVCRTTVYNHLAKDDLSPQIPVRNARPKLLDPYRPLIISWLEDDAKQWHKQRHSAHRIWVRLTEEEGVSCSESCVRSYVRALRQELGCASTQEYLDLVWQPAQAQADFGEADFSIKGVRTRLSFFVLDFPYSNIGLAQLFPSENAECVCQALKNIFEFIGGVPIRIVFDNATGVGRRVCERVRTTKLFSAFAAHYNFDFSFCNPDSGNEKGAVESKVKYVRSNLFVPLPRFTDTDAYNKRLLNACMDLAKQHYKKGTDERELFEEDCFALTGMPPKPFDVVRYIRSKADKQGKVKLDGPHWYSVDPALAGRELICAMRATTVGIYTSQGEYICEHTRAYGKAPTDTTDPANQLALLATKAHGWQNSQVRQALPDELRKYMDALPKDDLKAELRLMRDQCAKHGWNLCIKAMCRCLDATGRVDEAGVTMAALRDKGGCITYDEPVDLAEYDLASGIRKARSK